MTELFRQFGRSAAGTWSSSSPSSSSESVYASISLNSALRREFFMLYVRVGTIEPENHVVV